MNANFMTDWSYTASAAESVASVIIAISLIVSLVALALMIGFGIACSNIAGKKGRNTVGYFFFGFFFGIMGLIVILLLEDLRPAQHMFRRADYEYDDGKNGYESSGGRDYYDE